MIDVVVIAESILQMHVVVDRGKDIVSCNMSRNQVMRIAPDRLQQILPVGIFPHQLLQDRIVDLLIDSIGPGVVDIHMRPDIDHEVGQDLHIAGLCLNPNEGNAGILDSIRQLLVNPSARRSQDLTGRLIHHIFRQNLLIDPLAQGQLLIKLVAANLGQIIASGIKEHPADQTLRRLDRQRLTGADFLVELQKAALVRTLGRLFRNGSVFLKGGQNLWLLTEHLDDLLVAAQSQSSNQNRDRNLAGAVNANIEDVVGIRLILQPGSAIGNDSRGKELLADFVMVNSVVDTGRADQLRYNDALRAVDDKGTRLRHQRKVPHEDLMFVDLVGLLIIEANLYLKRSRVCGVPGLAFRNGVFDLIGTQAETHELQAQMAAEIRDGGDIIERLLHALIEKPLVGVSLNCNEIWHLEDFLGALIAHADSLAGFHQMYSVLLH